MPPAMRSPRSRHHYLRISRAGYAAMLASVSLLRSFTVPPSVTDILVIIDRRSNATKECYERVHGDDQAAVLSGPSRHLVATGKGKSRRRPSAITVSNVDSVGIRVLHNVVNSQKGDSEGGVRGHGLQLNAELQEAEWCTHYSPVDVIATHCRPAAVTPGV